MTETPSNRLELALTHAKKGVLGFARVAARWIVGDVTYAVLPLLVLTITHAILGLPPHEIWTLKEWSFANIVFFGVAQSKVANLRDSLPPQSRSWRAAAGIQLLQLGLVTSVLVLVFVVLDEHHVLKQETVLRHVEAAQVTLFVAGVLSILLCVIAEDQRQESAPGSASDPLHRGEHCSEPEAPPAPTDAAGHLAAAPSAVSTECAADGRRGQADADSPSL